MGRPAPRGEAAVSADRTQTFLGAKYRRLVRHMPKKKAQGAIMRTQLATCHALLSDPETGELPVTQASSPAHPQEAATLRAAGRCRPPSRGPIFGPASIGGLSARDNGYRRTVRGSGSRNQ